MFWSLVVLVLFLGLRIPKTSAPNGLNPIPQASFFQKLYRFLRLALDTSFSTTFLKDYGPMFYSLFVTETVLSLSGKEAGEFLVNQERNGNIVNNFPQSTNILLGDTPTTNHGVVHTRLRKISMEALKPSLLVRYIPSIEHMTSYFFLEKAEIDLVDAVKRITLSVMLELVFGIENVRSKEYQENDMPAFRKLFGVWMSGLFSPVLPVGPFASAKRAGDQMKQKLHVILKQQREKYEKSGRDPKHETFLILASQGHNGEKMTDEQLVDLAFLMLFAGHDTSSSTLVSLLHYLTLHPDLLERARKEQFDLFKEDRPITNEDLTKMPFLDALVKETLRSRPPVGAVMKRILNDTEFQGYHIPKNTIIAYNISGTLRHYHDPNLSIDTFNPDFFLNPKPPLAQSHVKGSLVLHPAEVPFGIGRHTCLGKNLVWQEVRVIMSVLLRRCKWSMPKDIEYSQFPIPFPKQKIMVQIERL
ncbi:cytochrome P450 [Gorgonomyces haynaldii]|nr:cytochrome P450 [Gorgonomyces haynaldii]